MKRAILSAVMNAGLVMCAYYGVIRGVEPALNVSLFFAWLSGFLAVIIACSKDAQKTVRDKGRSLPSWVVVSCDVFVCLCFASQGRFATAAILFLAMMIEQGVYSQKDTTCVS